MSKGASPTTRSTKYLRDNGWIVAKVEQKIHMPKSPYPVTRDAFNFGDLLAAHPQKKIIALVQVTGGQGGNLAARARKITDGEEGDLKIPDLALKWHVAGGMILCHGWAKRGARGKVKRFTLKVKEIVVRSGEGLFGLKAIDLEEHP